MAIGKCQRCGGRTRSASFTICAICARQLATCARCGKDLPKTDKPKRRGPYLCSECNAKNAIR